MNTNHRAEDLPLDFEATRPDIDEITVFRGFERAALKVADSINQIDAAIQSDADRKVCEALDEFDRIIAAGNVEDKIEAECNRGKDPVD
jgi:hypothetical protein